MARNPLVSSKAVQQSFSPVSSTNLVNQDDYPINKAIHTQEILTNDILKNGSPLVHRSVINFNYIKNINDGPTIIAPGSSGQWDDFGIREPGNIVKDGDTYKMLYTGYGSAYAENNVYLGYAYSSDGIIWTKYASNPVISTRSSEDPFVIRDINNIWHCFCEDKETVPFTGIRHYTSTDFINWTDLGMALDKGTSGQWDDQDVSSPTIIKENNTYYMLYEGRKVSGQQGSFGLANSTDLITWTKYASNPVFSSSQATWCDSVVPSDIIKIDDYFYCIYHGIGTTSRSAIAMSKDFINWTDYSEGHINIEGIYGRTTDSHIFYDGKQWLWIYLNDDAVGLRIGVPMTIEKLKQDTTANTLRIDDKLKIAAASSHLHFIETDNSDKEWHQEVAGSVFKIVETSVAERLTVDNTTGLVGVPSLTASKPVFTDANKKLSSSGTVPIANGGTNSTSFTSNTVPYYNGTSIVSDTDLQFDGSRTMLGAGTFNTNNKLQIYHSNTAYSDTNGNNAHLCFENPSSTGQSVFINKINGTMRSKWRTDYAGNISWVANGGIHSFYVGGDYGTGANPMNIYSNYVDFTDSISVADSIASPAIEDAMNTGGWMTIGDPYTIWSGNTIIIDSGSNLININTGDLQINGTSGFTGTGTYTNFTIQNGIITSAS